MEVALRRRWHGWCERAGVDADAAAAWWTTIASHHGEPGRAYHNLGHLAECFVLLDGFDDLSAEHASDVELAVWFHDLIYEPTRTDNEARSARQAEAFLADAGLAQRPQVTHAIEMTAGHQVGDPTPVTAAMHDVDLAILGAERPRYQEYARQIRQEYAHVADEEFRTGRARVLRSFAAQPQRYLRPDVVQALDARARANLAWELDKLDP